MSRSELDSEFQEIQSLAIAQGWGVDRTTSLHWRFKPPVAQNAIVIFSGTSSDHRALKNFISKMRRSGLNMPSKKKRRH
jgi:hypothetical protein